MQGSAVVEHVWKCMDSWSLDDSLTATRENVGKEGRKEGRKVGIWESKVIVGEARRRRNKEEEEKEEDDEEQVGAPTVPSAVIRGSN
jgi:hypothetical protein